MLTALIGRQNVAGPTLDSLGGDFGLAPLIGKPLAIISDARFVGKNGNIVVERLLSISGEDTLTVNRKYRDQWTGKLPAACTSSATSSPSSATPRPRSSGASSCSCCHGSWLGKEDHELERCLPPRTSRHLELGIGRAGATDRRQRKPLHSPAIRGRSHHPMRDLASPVAAFVREKCEVGADKDAEVDHVRGLQDVVRG